MVTKFRMERAGTTDGRPFMPTEEDVVQGTVLRMINPSDGSAAPFSDLVVLDVRTVDELDGRPLGSPYREVLLARPYLYATGTGNALTGTETLRVELRRIVSEGSQFRVLATARGNAHQSLT